MTPFAGAPPPLLVGLSTYGHECIITFYALPIELTEDDLLRSLMTGLDRALAGRVQDATVVFLRHNQVDRRKSARVGFPSPQIAQDIMNVRHELVNYEDRVIRKYHHRHDHPEDYREHSGGAMSANMSHETLAA